MLETSCAATFKGQTVVVEILIVRIRRKGDDALEQSWTLAA
jgi:hypothetical protein